jgi:myxalamid-type nonribosomal peptide synthetase MxaA
LTDQRPTLPPLFESDLNVEFDRKRLLQLTYSASNVKTASAILLTGSTGFLGIFLLKELLEKTAATIYCLVRASSQEEGLSKIVQKNSQASLGISSEQFKRVEVVVGDLDQPNLGIDAAKYEKLTDTIDVIFHCGAHVNWVLSYKSLRVPNFLGTIEIANFSTTVKLKPIHYVSTIGVADLVEEKLIASHYLPHLNNYSLSKYVAEEYLRNSGIPLAIYRPGMITGSSTSGKIILLCILLTWKGYSNPTDYVNRFISGIIQLKAGFSASNTIDMTPGKFKFGI